MKYWTTALAILTALSVSIALADDFKTIDGKEYKGAKVSRVEPDGVVLVTKSGISKVYFTELPKEVQERFHYDPGRAAAYAAHQTAAIQQTNQQIEESNKQQREAEEQKALENRLSQLQQQEEDLRRQIERAASAPTVEELAADAARRLARHGAEESMTIDEKNAQYAQRMNYYYGLRQAAAREGRNVNEIVPPKWGEADWDPLGQGAMEHESGGQASVSEADLRMLRNQLDSVRKDKERVEQELARRKARSRQR